MSCQINFLKLVGEFTSEMVKLYPQIIISSNLLDLESDCPNMETIRNLDSGKKINVKATFKILDGQKVHIINSIISNN